MLGNRVEFNNFKTLYSDIHYIKYLVNEFWGDLNQFIEIMKYLEEHRGDVALTNEFNFVKHYNSMDLD